MRSLVILAWLAGLASVAAAHDPAGTESIYRYRGAGGRTTYVNGLSRVPPRWRARAKRVDLSHISLNEDLSDDLQEAVDEQLSQLRATDFCASVRGLAARSWWRTAWERHGHLVVIGVLLLLFLLASPYLVRTLGMARWVRILMVLLPLCAFLALSTTVAVRTSRSLRLLHDAADPCGADAASTSAGAPPSGRANHFHMLQQLRAQVQAAHELRGQQLERFLEREAGAPL